ncbi:hypothetical protein [Priestia megaterium]|uniref:hypothetical protein n=1 Tax=Priestia megaterium TaxID=1404 RepID=UPI002448CA37|nr:hypothetical protein [Priestia megaterium]MDH2363532.1 hypothetical protein [Priestia megaterium]
MKIKLFFLMLLSFTFLISCSNQKATKEAYSDIKLELIKEQKLDKGISYEIKLINNSNAVLKQNNVILLKKEKMYMETILIRLKLKEIN